ncbi:hypothetical protein [Pseudonocardia sp. TRM90224]|uniref:hypothetical protein n=1 Tax=Pseudonocardia sp. TRM90224 TaxID=2812678 RepID=UPI001E658F6D|nr:hypothetical protein [Pseudonocardia sp. TRM90224]
MRHLRASVVVAVVCGLAVFAGNLAGLWWVTLLVGGVVGWFARPGAVAGLLVGTAVAWIAGMVWESGGGVLPAAGVVASLAVSDRAFGWAVALATVGYALLLAGSGAWLAAAARRMVQRQKETQHV